jgi:hypothetical protein
MSVSKQISMNSMQSLSRVLNDEILKQILNNLSIISKLRLERVSHQFGDCVKQVLSLQKTIKFIDSYDNCCDVFVNYDNKSVINLKEIGFQFNDRNKLLVNLLEKCLNLKELIFDNNIKISHQMIEWICNRCPNLESVSLLDYRCNYWTIDWIKISDCLTNKLIRLEIESRTNQHIYDKDLAQMVSKLELLQELAIVCPRRRLDRVFNNLGPNIKKLKITYSLGLSEDEINALISGNGKQLQELVIHYDCVNRFVDQNNIFESICDNLRNLEYFAFNHKSLTNSSFDKLTNLKSLKRFEYNFNGLDTTGHAVYNYNIWKVFKFSAFNSFRMPSLQSLTLNSVHFVPQTLTNIQEFFPNIKNLSLKAIFTCGCPLTRPNCLYCFQICIKTLANCKSLRYIHFGSPISPVLIECLTLFDQIDYFELNISQSDCNHILLLIRVLMNLANKRTNRLITAKTYGSDIKQVIALNKAKPKNLRIINI